jgi:hypothetical protein
VHAWRTLRVPEPNSARGLLCELCRYIHLSRHLRGFTTVVLLSHRGSRGRRRAEVRGRRWTKLRGARGTVERVRESNSEPSHTHTSLMHLAPCDVGLYARCHRRCVWARLCVRPPLLIAVRGIGRDHIPVCGPALACLRRHRLRQCRAAEVLEAAPNHRHAQKGFNVYTGVVPLLWNRDPWFPCRVLLR